MPRVSKKKATFIFTIISAKVDQFIRKDLQRKLELKLPSPLKPLA